MKDFYISFINIHSQIKEACDCILGNSCQKLKSEIETIKTTIDKVLTLDWQDSAGDKWQENKKACSNKLQEIIASIEVVFTKSEKIYNLLNEQLDNLKKLNETYQDVYKQKPNIADYKTPKYQTNSDGSKTLIGYEYNGYYLAMDKWQEKINDLVSQCEACIENSNNYINILKEINQTTITLAATSAFSTALNIPELVIPSIMGFTYKLSEYITTYSFNNSTYKIIETNKDYQQIAKKIGKQNPDKCLHFSDKYASSILSQSGGRHTASTNGKTTNALTSENENDILQIAANEILEGRPCILQVTGVKKGDDKYTRHFVTVAGIKDDADLNNLVQSDFLIIDPTSAGLKPLDTKMGDLTTRSLLSGKDTPSYNYDYLVLVYNDPDKYISNSCQPITNY